MSAEGGGGCGSAKSPYAVATFTAKARILSCRLSAAHGSPPLFKRSFMDGFSRGPWGQYPRYLVQASSFRKEEEGGRVVEEKVDEVAHDWDRKCMCVELMPQDLSLSRSRAMGRGVEEEFNTAVGCNYMNGEEAVVPAMVAVEWPELVWEVLKRWCRHRTSPCPGGPHGLHIICGGSHGDDDKGSRGGPTCAERAG